jgi:DNA-binding winged helix-turn-helix (wHTH) protein
MLNLITFYNKGFRFVRSAVKLNLVLSCSKDARHQIPYNAAEPNGKAFKLTTLIDATTLLD